MILVILDTKKGSYQNEMNLTLDSKKVSPSMCVWASFTQRLLLKAFVFKGSPLTYADSAHF